MTSQHQIKTTERSQIEAVKKIRLYANHLALTTRKREHVISLFWRYGDRRKLGEYRTWAGVERALRKITVEDLEGNLLRYKRNLKCE